MDKDKFKQGEELSEAEEKILLQLAEDVPQKSPSELLAFRFKKKLDESAVSEQKKKRFSGTMLWKSWAVVASILLVISFFNKENNVEPPTPTSGQDSLRLIHTLEGTAQAPDAKAWIFEEKSFQKKLFLVSGLKPLSAAKQYQLWLIKDGRRTSGAVFSIHQPQQLVVINSKLPLASFDGFGVTIEPHGGSPGPTGTKVL